MAKADVDYSFNTSSFPESSYFLGGGGVSVKLLF